VFSGVLLVLCACGGAKKAAPAMVTGSHLPSGLRVRVASAPSVPGGVVLSPVLRVTPTGVLASPATVHIRLDRAVPQGDIVIVRTAESAAGPWTVQRATVSRGGKTASIVTGHFSLLQALGFDLASALKAFKTDFIDGLDSGATQTVTKPSCGGQAAARADGYSIASNTTNTVYWCLGMQGSTRILKVTDDRRYPLEAFHPGLAVSNRGAIDWVSLASVSHWGSGKASIIAPGDTVTYTVDVAPGGQASLETETDGLGQSLTAIQVGADTLTAILTRFGAGSKGETVVADKAGQSKAAIDHLGDLLAIRSCADAFGKGSGAMISGCFSPKQIRDVFGVKGLLLAPVVATGEVIGFLHGEWNALIDQFSNHDKYSITITRAAPPAPAATAIVDTEPIDSTFRARCRAHGRVERRG